MTTDHRPDLSRRRLLARIGLAAGTAYMAPTLLQLTPAKASQGSRGSDRARASYSRPSYSRPSFSRPSRHDRHREDRHRYYERGSHDGPYRDRLTREERALEYLLETLTTR